jgi:large subunit ribosomal protein L35
MFSAGDSGHYSQKICRRYDFIYALRTMPKPIARSKTRKAVAKRFKITARGKVLRAHSSRRHLLSAKNAKRKRRLSKAARVDKTDVARVTANLPFG